MKKHLFPLGLFLALAATLALALQKGESSALPSPLVGKPAPAFTVAQLDQPQKQFSPTQLEGQVWVLNVWASWCVSCRKEHPVLLDFARRAGVPVVGLDYQDERPAAQQWLVQHGNPYRLVAVDADGRVGMDLGVYGVPETFVIDRQGRIRYRHAGPLTAQDVNGKLLPLIRDLKEPPRG